MDEVAGMSESGEEFLPCPFCGSDKIAERNSRYGGTVECYGCGATALRLRWNKRASDVPAIDFENWEKYLDSAKAKLAEFTEIADILKKVHEKTGDSAAYKTMVEALRKEMATFDEMYPLP